MRRRRGPVDAAVSWGVRASVVALVAGLTTACGFQPQTNVVNNIAVGAEDRSGTVDVLNAVVIAGEADLGVFSASLVNPIGEDPVTFGGLVPTGDLGELGRYASTEVPAGELVDLSDSGGVPVEGDFRAGQYVTVTLDLADDGRVTLDVPVVTPCHQYSLLTLTTIDLPGTADETVEPVEPVEGDTDPEPGEGPGAYTCEVEGGP